MTKNRVEASPTVTTQLRDQATVVGDDMQELGRIAKDAAQQTWDRSRFKAEEFEKSFEDQVRQHPLQSMLIAGSVGLVIGALLARK